MTTLEAICHGNGPDHCCYLYGEPCVFLGENIVKGRRWACTLRAELGSWGAVHADSRYGLLVEPVIRSFGVASCGGWGPGTNQCCYRKGD